MSKRGQLDCFLAGKEAFTSGYLIEDNPEGYRHKAYPVAWAIGWFMAYEESIKTASPTDEENKEV